MWWGVNGSWRRLVSVRWDGEASHCHSLALLRSGKGHKQCLRRLRQP
jgi:hypothetical protein